MSGNNINNLSNNSDTHSSSSGGGGRGIRHSILGGSTAQLRTTGTVATTAAMNRRSARSASGLRAAMALSAARQSPSSSSSPPSPSGSGSSCYTTHSAHSTLAGSRSTINNKEPSKSRLTMSSSWTTTNNQQQQEQQQVNTHRLSDLVSSAVESAYNNRSNTNAVESITSSVASLGLMAVDEVKQQKQQGNNSKNDDTTKVNVNNSKTATTVKSDSSSKSNVITTSNNSILEAKLAAARLKVKNPKLVNPSTVKKPAVAASSMSTITTATKTQQQQPTVSTTSTSKPKVRVNSRFDIERLVEKRLSSSWGRATTPSTTTNDTSTTSSSSSTISIGNSIASVTPTATKKRTSTLCEMHELINSIKVDSTTRTTDDENDNDDDDNDDVDEETIQKQEIINQQWNVIRERINSHSQELSMLDRRGRNCLHSICAKNPPLDVVNAAIKKSGRHGDIVMERDKNGVTPLHIAVSSLNSSASASANHNTTAANNNTAPCSYEVIQRLVISSNRAVSVCNHNGILPIHMACSITNADSSNNPAANHQRRLRQQQQQQQPEYTKQQLKQIKVVKLLLEANSQPAGRENNSGRTPLHNAIESDAPLDVVRMLVKACPQAVTVNGLMGINPLMLAIRRNAPVDTIRVMVEANPSSTLQRDRSGGLPLRRAIGHQASSSVIELLCTSKEVVLDTNNFVGNTALHETIEWSTPDESTIRLFLRTAPEVATLASKSGHTPLTLACQRYTRLLQSTNSQEGRRRRSRERQQRDNAQLQALWNALSLLIQAAHYGKVPRTEKEEQQGKNDQQDQNELINEKDLLPVLHACVAMNLPIEVFRTAFRMYPQQAHLMDGNNKYPLDYIISAPIYRNKSPIMKALLSAYPGICALPRPPNERSLLSVAAESTSITGNIFRTMYMAYPRALYTLDPIHKLYPFQIAALPKRLTLPPSSQSSSSGNDTTAINNTVTISSSTNNNKQKSVWNNWDIQVDEDLLQINSTYELLVAGPDLVLAHLRDA